MSYSREYYEKYTYFHYICYHEYEIAISGRFQGMFRLEIYFLTHLP